MTMTIEVHFARDSETKNAIKFQEVLNGRIRGVVGSLYVLRTEMDRLGNPSLVKVTIEAE
jgi:hypothetical protein